MDKPGPRRLRQDAGQSLVEYALILAVIGLVAVFGMEAVGQDVRTIFGDTSAALSPGAGGGGRGGGNGHGAGGNGNGNNGNGNGNSGTPPGGGRPR